MSEVKIPGAFWKAAGPDAFLKVCETSRLNEAQCKLLWSMLGRKDRPPKELEIFVDAKSFVDWVSPQLKTPELMIEHLRRAAKAQAFRCKEALERESAKELQAIREAHRDHTNLGESYWKHRHAAEIRLRAAQNLLACLADPP